MAAATTIVSSLEGRTTPVRGRFVLSGPSFQLVTDGSVASGAPGQAIGSLDLLVASLVSCGLNVLRGGGDAENELIPGREVEIYARVEREEDSESLGELVLEIFIEGASESEAHGYVADYRENCLIYAAVSHVIPIRFVVHGETAIEIDAG